MTTNVLKGKRFACGNQEQQAKRPPRNFSFFAQE
jgi:hypothetical protein